MNNGFSLGLLACLLTLSFLLQGHLAFVSGSETEQSQDKHELWAWGRNNAGQLGVVDWKDRRSPTRVSVIQGKRVAVLAVGGSDQMESHILALMSPGKLYSSGDNSHGQLGLGDTSDRDSLTPVPKVFSLDFVGVAAGEAHSLALTKSGEIYAWGNNQRGQLGQQNLGFQATLPERLKSDAFKEEQVIGIACGAWHSIAWLDNGGVYAWGDNSMGQLGTGDSRPISGLNRLEIPLERGEKILDVVSGGHHNLLLTSKGALYSWGKNDHGQLGLGKNSDHLVYTPTLVKSLSAQQKKKIVAGSSFSMVLNSKGEVFGFGDNSALQLGPMGDKTAVLEPKIIMKKDMPLVEDLSCGKLHCVALSKEGKTYTWGTDSYGQLGLDSSKRSGAASKPEWVESLQDTSRVFASVTGSYTITTKGEMYAWGKNNAGQLGLRSSKNPKTTPQVVIKVNEKSKVKSLSAGGYAFQYEAHTAVIMSNQEVYTWGWNTFGQLGNGDTEPRLGIPKAIPWLARQKLSSIVCGQFSTAAVTEDGDLYIWGLNEAGQLGRGDFTASTSDPMRITIDGRVKSVSIGYGHVLALTRDGRVFSWGKNFYGQLGLGDHRDKSSPQMISHLQEEEIVEVEAGQYHSLALTKAGDVYVWGYNRDYELGLNDNMDRVLPQELPVLKGRKITQISAGGYHTLAVTDEGKVYSWGLNNYGQLGRAADTFGKFPAFVAITTGVSGSKQAGRKMNAKKIAAGTWHSLAIVENTQVYAWGRCHFGQGGSKCGSSSSHSSQGSQTFPVRIPELEDKKVIDIAAGAAHSMAVVLGTD